MRDLIRWGVAIGAAFISYTILSKVFSSWAPFVNVFTLTVLYFSLTRGELAGAVMGTCCGLILDAFSLGIFGIAGLSNTLTGFLAGLISRRLNVLSFWRCFLFLFTMLSLEYLTWMFLTFLFVSRTDIVGRGEILGTPLVSAGLGTIFFMALRAAVKRFHAG